ncbi:hypothetical protein NPIL_300581 [Nephila pilipes]|uniref:Uncharacterized protein n=1 Tax=Nephila pilipes TaxID=299642 RepID=A0A8X6UPB9_NEPPI|nr:hypothetical protein NPIL_300581 [Nephila pilipes]
MEEPIKARFLADLQGRSEETFSKYNNVSPGRKQIPITTTTPECFITRFKAPSPLLITNTKHFESAEWEVERERNRIYSPCLNEWTQQQQLFPLLMRLRWSQLFFSYSGIPRYGLIFPA